MFALVFGLLRDHWLVTGAAGALFAAFVMLVGAGVAAAGAVATFALIRPAEAVAVAA